MKRPTTARGALLALGLALALMAGCLWTPDLERQDLEAVYLRSPADMITVNGTRLHVRDDGPRNAPALLMLHGMGSSLHTWEPWAQSLVPDFRVIRLDLPGSGLSPPEADQNYTDERSLRLLLALIDQLGVQKVTLVGNSMGGRIAWSFAAASPQRVDKLVLLAPDGFASPGFEYGQTPDVPLWLGAVRGVLPRALLRSSLAPAYADPQGLSEDTLRRYHDLMRAQGARLALLQRMQQTVLSDPAARLKSIQAPTLLLWGEQDNMIPVDNARDYLALIANSSLVRLPGLGHLPFEEDPERSLVPLRAFLAR